MELVEAANTPPISEKTLRDWLKKIHQLLATLKDGPGHLTDEPATKALLDGLLDTAFAPGLVARHRAAACNFVCAILDASRTPQQRWLTQPISEVRAWQRMLDVFFERFDVSMAKSMRQVLTALTNLLTASTVDRSERLELRTESVNSAWKIIQNDHDHVRVRPALQLLTQFLSKEVMTLREFTDFIELPEQSAAADSSFGTVTALCHHIFTWVQFDDVALPAAQFSTEVFKQFIRSEAYSTHKATTPPWQAPLLDVLQRSPQALNNFRNYALWPLFQLHVPAFFELLQACGLNDLLDSPVTDQQRQQPDGNMTGDSASELLYAALQVGKENGIVQINEGGRVEITHHNIVVIPACAVRDLLHARSSIVRAAGLSLAISSPTTTTPLSKSILRHLKTSLSLLFYETDAGFRGSVFSLLQRLIDRLRGALASLSKVAERRKKGPDGAEMRQVRELQKQQHEDFVIWLYKLSLSFLHPAATYSCHVSSLRILVMLARSGIDPGVDAKHLAKHGQIDLQWPMSVTIYTPLALRSLQDLIMDPYDDIRQGAALMLSMSPHFVESNPLPIASIQILVQRAQFLAQQTGRADQADGVGRAYAILSGCLPTTKPQQTLQKQEHPTQYAIFQELLSQLESSLATARHDFAEAVRSSPLHSNLIALKYMLEQSNICEAIRGSDLSTIDLWRAQFQRLCCVIADIWNVVQPVLCNDAPEGYVLDDTDEMSNFTTKDTLSYCWRALKESSSLIKTLVTQPSVFDPSGTPLLADALFEMLGELTFTQLSELRHRGAFSTVAQTFSACCHLSLRARDGPRRALIEQWYARTLSTIEAKGASLTRRSAGLPSLLTGILSADVEQARFHATIEELINISQRPVPEPYERDIPLPQVHAMNCLRMIYINSKLGDSSDGHVLEGLQLAASRLGSSIWAIRNSALMLFRALLDRMLGTFESGNSEDAAAKSRFSYTNYPTLLDIVEGLLRIDTDGVTSDRHSTGFMESSASVEKVFPPLHLLQRAMPPKDSCQRFVPLVLKLTSCAQWHVRDLAARALVRLTAGDPVFQLFSLFPPIHQLSMHQNMLHGYLLFLHHLIRHYFSEISNESGRPEALRAIHDELLQYRTELGDENACWITKSAYSDLLHTLTSESFPLVADGTDGSTQLKSGPDVAIPPTSLFNDDTAPSSTEKTLMAWSSQVATQLREDTPLANLREDLYRLASAIRLCLEEHNTFTLRLAAVHTLTALADFWEMAAANPVVDQCALDFMLSTYDALNDDDEDIRDQAAAVAHRVLLSHGSKTTRQIPCPPHAAKQLVILLLRRFDGHPTLCQAAADRLASLGSGRRKTQSPISVTIAHGLEADTTLFVQEKQNLYIDELTEICQWSHVLKHLQSGAVKTGIAAQLSRWVMDGLQSATQAALSQSEGVLGWASKPVVFMALMRLLCAADVLLTWRSKTKKVPVSGAELRKMLFSLSVAGQAAKLHPMLLLKLEAVLRNATLRRLQSLSKTLRAVASVD